MMRQKLAPLILLGAAACAFGQQPAEQGKNPYDSLSAQQQLEFYKAQAISLTAQLEALQAALKAQQDAYTALQAQIAAAPAIQVGNQALKQANDLLAKINGKSEPAKSTKK